MRCWQICISSGGYMGESFPCLPSFWRDHIPRVTTLCFQCSTFHHSPALTLCLHCSRFSDSILLPAFYKDPCDCIRPIQVIPSNFPISKSLTGSPPQSLFCHGKYHIHRFWKLGHGHLWSHFSTYHRSVYFSWLRFPYLWNK